MLVEGREAKLALSTTSTCNSTSTHRCPSGPTQAFCFNDGGNKFFDFTSLGVAGTASTRTSSLPHSVCTSTQKAHLPTECTPHVPEGGGWRTTATQ